MPLSREPIWLPYTGKTADEVRKKVRDNEMVWEGVFISQVDSVQPTE